MLGAKTSKVFTVRMPNGLGDIIEARAQADGITSAEVLRNVIHAWAYGEAPGANEGYYIARGNGARIAHWLIGRAFASLPASEEEARELLAHMPPLSGLGEPQPLSK